MPQTEEEHLENQNLDNDDSDRSQPDAEVSFSFLGVRITQANDNYINPEKKLMVLSLLSLLNSIITIVSCFVLFCFVYDFVTFCSSFAFFQLIN